MLREIDSEKRQALIDLMSMPDDPTLRRGHHRTLEGRSDRYTLAQSLASSFVQWHLTQREERSPDWVLHS